MRLSRVLWVGALSGLLAGCLSDIVPLYQPVERDGGSEPGAEDMAQGQAPAGDMKTTAIPDLLDCVPKTAAISDGHHNPGLNCLTCHDGNTAGAPKYFVAGTLYDSIAGTNPVPGATVQISYQGGVMVSLPTMANGNFYTESPVVFPLAARATGCPTTIPMVAQVQTGQGGCNQAGCHDTATNRIHLP